MIDVSILLATCGRWQMLDDMFSSLAGTIPNDVTIEIIAVIDKDVESYKVAAEYQVNIVDFSMKRRGALWSWNRALQLSSGRLLVPTGDDQVFHPDWLKYALESHQDRLGGYGMVGLNDCAYDGNKQVSTMMLFDRAFCKEVLGGVIAYPAYHYFCVDLELNERAKQAGKFYWDSRSKVEHLHSAHNKRPLDELDKEKMDAGWMAIDNQTYLDRKALGFPNDFEAVI